MFLIVSGMNQNFESKNLRVQDYCNFNFKQNLTTNINLYRILTVHYEENNKFGSVASFEIHSKISFNFP